MTKAIRNYPDETKSFLLLFRPGNKTKPFFGVMHTGKAIHYRKQLSYCSNAKLHMLAKLSITETDNRTILLFQHWATITVTAKAFIIMRNWPTVKLQTRCNILQYF